MIFCFLGLAAALCYGSQRDHWETIAGRAGIAGMGAGGTGQAFAHSHRHNPAYGIICRTDQLAYLDALSGSADAGESRHSVPQ